MRLRTTAEGRTMVEGEPPSMTSAYRPEFEAALRLFARASEAMHRRGFQRPILVGGAAAEFYTTSALTTGDFDICTLRQAELEDELQALGFVRPSGPGQMLKGWVHPDLRLGFEACPEPVEGLSPKCRWTATSPRRASASSSPTANRGASASSPSRI